jgi:hypothetical protein
MRLSYRKKKQVQFLLANSEKEQVHYERRAFRVHVDELRLNRGEVRTKLFGSHVQINDARNRLILEILQAEMRREHVGRDEVVGGRPFGRVTEPAAASRESQSCLTPD